MNDEIINYVMDTPSNTNPNVLKGLLNKADGPAGPSSLADLNDVEIDLISKQDGDLLKLDDNNGKWKNVSPVAALFGSSANADQGVIYLTDAGRFQTASAILLNPNTDAGQALSQLVNATVTYGQYQLDGFDASQAAMLINAAAVSALSNTPCYLGLLNFVGVQWAIPLTAVSLEFASWSGNLFADDKLLRLTVLVYSPDNAESATIMAKAEELMTYTEPT